MSMLGHDDRERLAEIERHLTADDPAFAARMRAPRRSRLSWPLVLLMAVLWAVANSTGCGGLKVRAHASR
jgi:hypothetical protein